MQIVIDSKTRQEVCQRFGVSTSLMSLILHYNNNGIMARRVRAHILNNCAYHIVG